MTIAVDTNVLSYLFRGDDEKALEAGAALLEAARRDRLVISAPVHAELLAEPRADAVQLEALLRDVGVHIVWHLDEAVWRLAALAYRGYAERRRAQPGDGGPRRILTDFVIGAHASLHANALLTSDVRVFRAAFPSLMIIRPGAG